MQEVHGNATVSVKPSRHPQCNSGRARVFGDPGPAESSAPRCMTKSQASSV